MFKQSPYNGLHGCTPSASLVFPSSVLLAHYSSLYPFCSKNTELLPVSQTCHTCSQSWCSQWGHQSLCPRCSSGWNSLLLVFTWLVPSPALGLYSNVNFSVWLSLTILLRETQTFRSLFPAFFFSTAHNVVCNILYISLIDFVSFFLQQECKLHRVGTFIFTAVMPEPRKVVGMG